MQFVASAGETPARAKDIVTICINTVALILYTIIQSKPRDDLKRGYRCRDAWRGRVPIDKYKVIRA